MDLGIRFEDKNLAFKTSGECSLSGEGLDGILSLLEKYGTIINRVKIKGQSRSFSFTRQIYIFANLFKNISTAEVTINGRSIKHKVIIPQYPKNI